MEWHLQSAAGQLLTTGFGKTDAKLKLATHSSHSLPTFKLQQVEIPLAQILFPQFLLTSLMEMFVEHNMTDSVTAAVIVDGAGLQMILPSGLQQMQIVDA
jgi:hypothetical protein